MKRKWSYLSKIRHLGNRHLIVNKFSRMFSERKEQSLKNQYVTLTFDTEEDWQKYPLKKYFDSYKYIASGALSTLVESLAQRQIAATWYVTPGVAQNNKNLLPLLKEHKQHIGVHVHPHNLQNVIYPYTSDSADRLTVYSYDEKYSFMKKAKEIIEECAGHVLTFFRSGHHSCDREVERIAWDLGFKAISNHPGVYPFILSGLWNLGASQFDICDSNQYLTCHDYLAKWHAEKKQTFRELTGHPMLLFNHMEGRIQTETIEGILAFLDVLKHEEKVCFVSQEQLLQMKSG